MDETITAHEILAPATRTSGTFHFDRARYDAASDVIHLEKDPPAASFVEDTPEGHRVRIDALENRILGLEIEGARRLTRLTPTIEITIGPGQRLALDAGALRPLVRGGRFEAAPTALEAPTLGKASRAKALRQP